VLALDLDRPIGKLRDLVLSSMPLLRMSVSMKAKSNRAPRLGAEC
jgi:hypothetical protein